ncbi:carboxypeptidase regulatory-like domain-containing protein [Silvibacterium acidisoli]|uniref:carboxypeptidase regulatory-like domain-containing protein n=1 Tax=Acidobacteriaceae bacterium ZG23-2 TaxID=2883246 RepID=UPI00406C7B0E
MILRKLLRIVFPVLLILSVPCAFADITGVISGLITDPSGAAIPGVTVTATNQQTGVAVSTVSDGKGFYSFPVLPVGIYTVKTAQSSFREFSEENIRIDANSSVRVDVALKVGSVTETEHVEADALQVETANTQLGEVIQSTKIEAVPLNGRSFTDLLQLQPGVSPYKNVSEGGSRPVSGDLNAGNQSVNGGREASNGFMINGADANEGVENGAAIVPNLDSIAEFRIITNNFNAEYGNFSGGQVNVVTKSGTNNFHGDVFDFLRNTDLDARNYFAQQRGVFIQNIFGGVLGGPVKKDKIFFFGDFQGTKQIQGLTQNYPVPSAASRSGNVASLISQEWQNGASPITVNGNAWANVLSQRLGYAVTPGEQYFADPATANSGNPQLCTSNTQCVFPNGQVPTAAWDTPAAHLIQYIPQQNVSNGNYSTAAFSQTLSDYKGSGRVDINTHMGSFFGYYFVDSFTLDNPYGGGNTPGFAATTKGKAQMVNLGWTKTFSSSTVNDFRFAYLRDVNLQGVPTGSVGTTLSSLGFVSPWGPSGGIGAINPAYEAVPNVSFNSFTIGVPADTLRQYNNTFQWIDNYTRVIGSHTLQFGASYHYDQINERNYYGENGSFGFNGQESQDDFTDFLIGAPASFIQASLQILDSRSHYVGAYAQDSWRATPSLTLNMGLRYEISTPWYDTQNKLEAIVPGVQSVLFPGAPKGYLVPGDPGVPRTLAPIRWNNVAPRFGFAFTPQTSGWTERIFGAPGKTSVRGGYGIFYTNIQDATGFVEVGDAPYGLFYASPVPSQFSTPFIDRATGNSEGQRFPFVFPSTKVSASNPDTSFNWAGVEPISGSLAFDIHNTLPYIESFFLSYQRELTSKTVLSVNYVGNIGRKLITQEESNPGDPNLCLSLNSSTLAPGQTACGPGLETNVYTLADGTTVEGTRPILGINFASDPYMKTAASSSYNSLQIALQQNNKYADLLIGYTYGRSFDNSSAQGELTNVFNPLLSRGLSSFDVTHNFVASYNVPLPIDGFLPQKGLVKKTLGGWAVSGITTFATGLPITMSEGDDRSLTGTSADLPNYDPTGGKLYADKNPRHGNPYFNTNLFSVENLGSFGNSKRRFFHGPGLNNTDLALLKTFGFTDSTKLEFRAEAFNVFNHAQFNNPSGSIDNLGPGGMGYINSANDPRIMQVALKLLF